ncbi:MAG: class II fructose-bisphosphate aldolase [Candidatus Moraniibacteriota bacterium]
MLVSVKKLLQGAQEGGYALGAFNTANLETTRAIFEAASELRSPVIIQMTEKTFQYAGSQVMYHLVRNIADFSFPEVPYGLHLDHGRNIEVVEEALRIGFKSVMMDASTMSYEENLAATKRIVANAHGRDAEVQAELGNVPYIGEIQDVENMDWEDYMTDPEKAEEFVRETGIDTLAIAIGNAHAAFPERPEPDYERLQAIREKVTLPLVLHGASDWTEEKVSRVIGLGISCFNVDTATRTAFLDTLREFLSGSEEKDIRKVLLPAREAFRDAVKKKMEMFGSAGKM